MTLAGVGSSILSAMSGWQSFASLASFLLQYASGRQETYQLDDLRPRITQPMPANKVLASLIPFRRPPNYTIV